MRKLNNNLHFSKKNDYKYLFLLIIKADEEKAAYMY